MNEQHPTEDTELTPTDSFVVGQIHSYGQSFESTDALTAMESVAALPTPEPANFLANEAQEVARLDVPPLAQPLQSSVYLSGLGSFATHDTWDENRGESTETGSHDSTRLSPQLSAVPLPTLATPEAFDPALRLTSPLSRPKLPSVALPTGIQNVPSQITPVESHIRDTPPSISSFASIENASEYGETPVAPTVVSGWEPQSAFVNPDAIALSAQEASPQVLATPAIPAFPALPSFAVEPEFGAVPAFSPAPPAPTAPPALLTSPSAFPPGLALPLTPPTFEAPPFPPAPSFPESPPITAPPLLTARTFDPHVSITDPPFDPADSFAAPGFSDSSGSVQAHSDAFGGPVEFSANPLPRPEALVLRSAEEPTKTPRFGRKKQSPANSRTLHSDSTTSAPDTPVSSKIKRFGKKSVQTIDLLGTPIATRTADAADAAPVSVAPTSPIQIAATAPGLSDEGTHAGKKKRKFFATVDRSKEKPLTPQTGRSRKIVQGLAGVSLLAGVGLFTLSFLDKKAPTPAAPAVKTTSPAIVSDATASGVVPVLLDPATGLAVEPVLESPETSLATPDAVTPTPSLQEATAGESPSAPADTILATGDAPPVLPLEAQTPQTSIAPGPDDLEFSTGGNFSEG